MHRGVINLPYQSPVQDISLLEDEDPNKTFDAMIKLMEDSIKKLKLLKSLDVSKIDCGVIYFDDENNYKTAYDNNAIEEYNIEDDDLDNIPIPVIDALTKAEEQDPEIAFSQICLKLEGPYKSDDDTDDDQSEGMYQIPKKKTKD